MSSLISLIKSILAYFTGKKAGEDAQKVREEESANVAAQNIAEAESKSPNTDADLVARLRDKGL